MPPLIIVSDGEIMDEALKELNLNRKWLFGILKTEKLDLSDVFIMTSDLAKNYKIFKKE